MSITEYDQILCTAFAFLNKTFIEIPSLFISFLIVFLAFSQLLL